MTVTLITLALAAAGFVWGKLRADVVALLALLVLALSGVITVGEALSGFANPIVIMMIGLFVVGGAIFNTGLAKMIGAGILKYGGGGETRLFLLVVIGTALIGGFVSNTGTVALMLPIVVSMAATGGISVRRLLMPIAFASSMGGMLTLIGTPPNLVIAEAWEEAGHAPLSFFAFLPAGAVCLAAGTALMLPLSKWFLRRKEKAGDTSDEKGKTLADLVAEYDLNSDLFRLDVTPGSLAIGKTLVSLDMRATYGIDVLEVRKGEISGRLLKKVTHTAPDPTAPLREGETMYVRGPKDKIEEFARRYSLVISNDDNALSFYDIGIAEIVPVPNSPILGKTVSALDFRNRYGVNVVGLRHKGVIISKNIADITLHAGDILLVQGSWKAIGSLSKSTRRWVVLGEPAAQASAVTLDYKAPVAAIIMLAMIVALIFDFIAPVIAVMTAAILMVLGGCFRNVDDAYRTISWESVVLIAAMMPMSFALEKTGVSALVSQSLVTHLGTLGPTAVMAGIYLATSVMTLFISNTATAVLMAPIALSSAVASGVSPLPFLFAVTFAASLCFASPFSTPPNALVMPVGQYKFMDYIKVGLPLQVLLGLLMIFVLPLIFPY